MGEAVHCVPLQKSRNGRRAVERMQIGGVTEGGNADVDTEFAQCSFAVPSEYACLCAGLEKNWNE